MPAPEESYELDRDCPLCIHCGDTGEVFGHADDCTDDLCALNGDMHSCAGKVEPCHCSAGSAGVPGTAYVVDVGLVPTDDGGVAVDRHQGSSSRGTDGE